MSEPEDLTVQISTADDAMERMNEIRRQMSTDNHLKTIRDVTKSWIHLETLEDYKAAFELIAGLFAEMDEALKAGAKLPSEWKEAWTDEV